jgi:hypothetical protein
MSQDPEKIRKLVEFKEKIEKRIEQLKSELDELQITLEFVKSILLEKGFKRAEITVKPEAVVEATPTKAEAAKAPPTSQVEYENVIPLKAMSGELLATLYVGEDTLRVVPAEDKNFNVNTPPFTSFLIERVLMKMQEKDLELAKAGQLPPEKVFSYNIAKEGDIFREIYIKNADEERLRELKSSIRWTLEKMYEKMKSQS